jgi:dephospho-CoA kinase
MRQVMQERFDKLRADNAGVVVLEAAVLLEADWVPLVDEVWVVTVRPALARERIVQRNGLTPEQADQRIAAQLTNDERTKRAQVVIENDGTLEQLERRVDDAWRGLQAKAGAR